MSKSVIILIRLFACISILFTFIPLLTAEEWFVRVFDFPRMQIFIFALFSLLSFYFFDFRKRKRGWVLLFALLLTAGYQAYNIYPYTPSPLYRVKPVTADSAMQKY